MSVQGRGDFNSSSERQGLFLFRPFFLRALALNKRPPTAVVRLTASPGQHTTIRPTWPKKFRHPPGHRSPSFHQSCDNISTLFLVASVRFPSLIFCFYFCLFALCAALSVVSFFFSCPSQLAPRDVVSRTILSEMRLQKASHMYLDISHRPADWTRARFPGIDEHCTREGFDMTAGPLPVVPAAHYFCGGVATDLTGRTTVPGLFAAGEGQKELYKKMKDRARGGGGRGGAVMCFT